MDPKNLEYGDRSEPPVLVVMDLAVLMAPVRESVTTACAMALADADYPVDPARVPWSESLGMAAQISGHLARVTRLDPGVIRPLARAVYRGFLDRLRGRLAATPAVARPGAGQVLAELQSEGIRVHLDTPWEPEMVQILFGSLGWRCGVHVDGIVTGPEVGRTRPAPDLILESLRQAGGVPASRVAKLAGGAEDVEAARAAGCAWIGVLSGGDGAIRYADVRTLGDLGEFAERVLERCLV